jgi:hypothetical protein
VVVAVGRGGTVNYNHYIKLSIGVKNIKVTVEIYI